MQVVINPHYLKFLDSMIQQIEVSLPGKRRWTNDPVTGQANYSDTTRSTFPDWSKFFYVTTPKKLRHKRIKKLYLEGYFNGNTYSLLRLLNQAKSGTLSKSARLRFAFDLATSGFYDYLYEFEYQYGETYL